MQIAAVVYLNIYLNWHLDGMNISFVLPDSFECFEWCLCIFFNHISDGQKHSIASLAKYSMFLLKDFRLAIQQKIVKPNCGAYFVLVRCSLEGTLWIRFCPLLLKT